MNNGTYMAAYRNKIKKNRRGTYELSLVIYDLDRRCICSVSYTHLDVYKRQM